MRTHGSTPHPLPATLAQVENLRRQRYGWRAIGKTLNLGKHVINTHYRPRLPEELRGSPRPLGPDAPRRCGCGLALQDDERACALCELQAVGILLSYTVPGLAREVGDWLDGEMVTG